MRFSLLLGGLLAWWVSFSPRALACAQISRLANLDTINGMVGSSETFNALRSKASRLAISHHPVFIQGETGSGKEGLARFIHQSSDRNGKFIARNVATFATDLNSSDLFGHEKGAFTGAQSQRQGVFELASGGTLFLDEIAELTPDLQSKLLRVLDGYGYERVGGNETLSTNVRLIVATGRDLALEVRAGRFRQDLYYRLTTLKITLPPLRERKEDIAEISESILNQLAVDDRRMAKLSPAALERLMDHSWPGNIRELKNVLTRAVWNCENSIIEVKDLEFDNLELP